MLALPRMNDADRKEDNKKMGGLAFFLSFLAVSILAIVSLYVLPRVINSSKSLENWSWFSGGFLVGLFFGHKAIRGKPAVLIHEIKHSLLSNFVGNKWKSLEVEEGSGHFQYAHTKRNAKYNAFISLAPYWLPIFLLIAVPLGYATMYPHLKWITAFCGAAFGADFALNMRDVSPLQSDFADIRGGFTMGLSYVIAVNTLISVLVAVWVSDGSRGFKTLSTEFIQFGSNVLKFYR